ncbi:glycoside hydrolase family 18 protein [Paenibacillus elgii]|uniref:glycoside hydrolase family 18 protein n=1 Tax=Paenibacillus elgii TaxID=189691 RepID=UPI000FD6292E|nr:glycosyl hydrolase family 18 protein [Paenibacillus elgii]NEN83010.1 chitinase [Paenibacillus elgii]
MKISIYTKLIIVLLLAGMGIYFYVQQQTSDRKITSVYIVPSGADIDRINLSNPRVDIGFIAFAKIDKNRLYFHTNSDADAEIRENIKTLRANNRQTNLVLGVGGYGADGFSDASLAENRGQFTDNIVAMVKELDLDGIDIDWEYPASDAWNTQKSRPEDTQNFTYLMKELREKLNRLPHKKQKKYLLTFASGTQDWYFRNVEVKKVEKYVDFINVMSYDLTGRWSQTTGYNSNLYADAGSKTAHSVDAVITMYLEHGIDPQKLLMGIPAYSYGWEEVKSDGDGLYAEGKPIDIDKVDLSYKTIEAKYIGKNGFKRYYDDHAKAAYLYDGKTFVSYEDKEALKAKIAYIQQKDLAGAMVWEYSQDAEHGLVKFLSEQLQM